MEICYVYGVVLTCASLITGISSYTAQPYYCQNLQSQTTVKTYSSEKTSVRLAGGNGYSSGRVEIYHSGEWGTICDHGFDSNEANVICRMLGFSYGSAHSGAYYGSGRGCIILNHLQCNGYESDIAHCRSNGWFNNHCNHAEDASVSCYGLTATGIYYTTRWMTSSVPYYCQNLQSVTTAYTHFSEKTPVRLVGGNGFSTGRVEIYHSGEWGTICDHEFDNNDAEVICRMLGYSYGYAHRGAYYGPGRGCIILNHLQCNGYESDIALCRSNWWFNNHCNHREDASVSCYGFTTTGNHYSRHLLEPTETAEYSNVSAKPVVDILGPANVIKSRPCYSSCIKSQVC